MKLKTYVGVMLHTNLTHTYTIWKNYDLSALSLVALLLERGGGLGESIGSTISCMRIALMHNYFQLKGPVAPTNFGNCCTCNNFDRAAHHTQCITSREISMLAK
jgi:hypothetical protein